MTDCKHEYDKHHEDCHLLRNAHDERFDYPCTCGVIEIEALHQENAELKATVAELSAEDAYDARGYVEDGAREDLGNMLLAYAERVAGLQGEWDKSTERIGR